MKKFIAGIIVGILIGVGLYSMISSSQVSNVAAKTAAAVQPESVDVKIEDSTPPVSGEKKMEMLGLKTGDVVLQLSPGAVFENTEHNEVSASKVLNIDLSEEQVTEMEMHLPELQKDVSLFRDNEGWIVRFHTQGNILSNVGIKDNDLIRFGQIQELKKDPEKVELISRLEAIFHNLQR